MGEDPVADARRAVSRKDWRDAGACYARADQRGLLTAGDLQDWAQAAYLTGDTAVAEATWSRAYQEWTDHGTSDRAVRCAFWLGLTLLLAGQHAKAGGWFARATRLAAAAAPGTAPAATEGAGLDVQLLLPEGLADLYSGRAEAALATFEHVSAHADAANDPDLTALARLGRGQALVALGQVRAGLVCLDEVMLAVVSGEVSPVAAGIVYCAVILTCRDAFDVPRAQQWTTALAQWCEQQQGIQPYRGQCLVHRSELLQLRGQWPEALAAAQEARAHLAGRPGDPALGMACYQLGELWRLRGEHDQAEVAYREAGTCGHPVQPGLALLRLEQGDADAATRALTAALAVTTDRAGRLRLLAAAVEVALATGDTAAARGHLDELGDLSADVDSDFLLAIGEGAVGRVLLAEGSPEASARALRRARSAWLRLQAPHQAAQTGLHLAEAYRALGDPEAAELERAAANARLAWLHRASDHAAPDRSTHRPAGSPATGPLTARQVEVLAQVATGATNRQIAASLAISEHTVRRHLQNIFTALDLPSRAAATAWAYRRGLLPPE